MIKEKMSDEEIKEECNRAIWSFIDRYDKYNQEDFYTICATVSLNLAKVMSTRFVFMGMTLIDNERLTKENVIEDAHNLVNGFLRDIEKEMMGQIEVFIDKGKSNEN